MKTNRQIIAGMATIKERKYLLSQVIISILPQVDKLIIYQNDYKDLSYLSLSNKIEIYSKEDTGIDYRSSGKFYKASEYPNDYYFSIDDDIIYPPDYVENTISKMKYYGNNVVVSYHGRNLKPNATSYYRDYSDMVVFHLSQRIDVEITYIGTGVMCMIPSTINFNLNDITQPNMTDIEISLMAKKNNIKCIVLSHRRNWIKPIINNTSSIYGTQSKDDRERTNFALTLRQIGNELNKKFEVSILITAYNAQDYIEETLDSILHQNGLNIINYEIIVGVDACNKTLQKLESIKHKYKNLKILMMDKNVGTYITRNTLVTEAKYDNLLFFDSDDIMYTNLLEEVFKYITNNEVVYFHCDNFYVDTMKIERQKWFSTGVFLIKKGTFNKFGGFLPNRFGCDSEFHKRIKNFVKFKIINEPLFKRRKHQNNLTTIIPIGSDVRTRWVKENIKKRYTKNDLFIEPVKSVFKII